MTARRLPDGGRINRTTEVPFTWNGKPLRGYAGDTLASALLANDIALIGRSFKYHRPRGIMSAGVEESGALVTLGDGARRDANVKATVQELYPGLTARSQNAWPSVRFDIGAIANLFGRFLAAGFYYKTFMGVRGNGTAIWMQWEKLIRNAAGMGEASRLPDPDSYEHGHGFCDVLVVGGGPAGLSAATTVARAGLDVLLVEQDCELGGDWLRQPLAQAETKRGLAIKDAGAAGVRIMTRTTAFGLYDHQVAGLLERVTDHLPHSETAAAAANSYLPRQRFWIMRARHIILATGALEQPIAFGNNDRPGVMSASAARAYLHRFGVLPGQRIVAAANNDSAYPVAAELAAAGAGVILLDARSASSAGGGLQSAAEEHGVTVRLNCAPLNVLGGMRVRALETAVGDGDGWRVGESLSCDLVLVSGGWSPAIHLYAQRMRPVWNAELACFLAPEIGTGDMLGIAGSAAGIWQTDACETSGQVAGEIATRALSASNPRNKKQSVAMPAPGGWHNPIRPLYEVAVPGRKNKKFVDPQNDVTADDVRLAHREGFVSVEHLKRYTTLGMSTDGGKVGNVVGLALMADALRCNIAEVGTTTFRPPYTPVALGALRGQSVGEHFRPLRRTPMHQWNLNHNATMTMAGLWHRPWYYATDADGKMETLEQAYIREAATVRDTVGLCDVTSLGKIAVQGPDASEFLNRIYTNAFAKLPVGKARYGIMLRDDGMVMDDGTTWRLSASDYFMTTTTAHAAKVMAWLEELLHTRWPGLRVHVTSVSDQWAGCAVAGPKSRTVLRACVAAPATVDNDALPFMGVVETELNIGDGDGVPCRIARISFSGEMAFEIYTPSDYATLMMDLLWAKAKPVGGCLYGLEALGTLRIEKGHVTGAELDGRVTLEDAALGNMASPNKTFIGDALRKRPQLLRDDRPQLTGIKPKQPGERFNAGAILCSANKVSGLGDGWITAVTHSPALGHWIGIGFIRGGHHAWQGKRVIAADPVRKGKTEVEMISPHMFDPGGERMRG